jgi:hypothetical protein
MTGGRDVWEVKDLLGIALLSTLLLFSGCQKRGGTIFAVALHPSRPDVLYLSSEKGLYKTTDGGANWSRIKGVGTFSALSIAINPEIPSTVYVGTFLDGVYRSTDGGRNWLLVNAGMRDYVSVVNAVEIDPKNPSTLYAGTTMGAYRSLDNGAIWERISAGLNSMYVVCLEVDPENPNVIYAGTSGGVYRSSNGGLRWSTSNRGMIAETDENAMALGVNALAVDPGSPGRLLAATARGLYESRDGAGHWIRLGLPEPFVLSALVRSKTIYAGTNRGLFRSLDDGRDWEKIAPHEVRAIAIDPIRPDIVYIGTGSGLFRSDDGGKEWRLIEFVG